MEVRRMLEIYHRASQVQIWLGVEEQDSTIAIKHIQEAADMNLRQRKENRETLAPVYTLLGRTSSLPEPNACIIEALTRFFGRPWWSRAWVVQELVAAEKAQFHCGSDILSIDHFHNGVEYICTAVFRCRRSTPHPYSTTSYQNVLTMFDVIRQPILKNVPLLWLLKHCADLDATKPEDKIYSLLGLAGDNLNIVPDYTQPPIDIYTRTAQEITVARQDLKILCYSGGSGSLFNLPS